MCHAAAALKWHVNGSVRNGDASPHDTRYQNNRLHTVVGGHDAMPVKEAALSVLKQ
jgi:hypothetical protein